MAKNYTQPGAVIQYTCGSSEEVSSGDVVFVSGIPGVALVDIGNSESGAVQITGVFELPKHTVATHGTVFNLGDPVYWDAAEEEAVSTVGLPFLGYAFEAAALGDATVNVLLVAGQTDAPIRVVADGAVAANDLVYPSGYDANKQLIKVKKAEADGTAPAKVAWYIAPAGIDDGAVGIVKRSLLVTGVDTDAPDVGAPVYLSTTAGGWTHTAPTGAATVVQQVGVVTASDATDGAILFLVGDSKAATATA